MTAQATETDRALGLGVLLSTLAIGGALVMLLQAGTPAAGWGFAAAMTAAALAVVAFGAA